MRRLGALFMILGANFIAGAIALAFYFSNVACALSGCTGGAFAVFADLMTSVPGLVYWLFIIVGALLFWRGQNMRRAVINRNGE